MATDKNTKSEAEIQQSLEAARARGQNTLPLFPVVADTRPAKPKPARKAAAPLPAVIAPKPNEQPNTRKELKLIAASALIADERPNGDDMVFTHTVLCQVGLPRSKILAREFMRKSGDAWINIQAGMLDEGHGPVEQPLPYGATPRLALAWVSTFAKRNATREIPLGDNATQFLKLMGIEDESTTRYTMLRKQMHALAACRLQLGYKGRTFNDHPIKQFDAWQIGSKTHDQKPLWPGVMILTESYYNELMLHGVPLDKRALQALTGSALSLDIYTWLAHRLYRVEGRPSILHWKSIREQFGQEYTGKDPDKDFKKVFLPALHAALAVYPKARVKQVTGGIMLLPSPPPVPFSNS